MQPGADHISPDTAKAVDSNSNGHIFSFYGGGPTGPHKPLAFAGRVDLYFRLLRDSIRQPGRGPSAKIRITLLDFDNLALLQGHKRYLAGRIAINPGLDLIAIRIRFAALIARLAQRKQQLILIHALNRPLLLDRFLNRLGQSIEILLSWTVLNKVQN